MSDFDAVVAKLSSDDLFLKAVVAAAEYAAELLCEAARDVEKSGTDEGNPSQMMLAKDALPSK